MSDKMSKLKEAAGENVLDKDQLDQISGGGYKQISQDTKFFHEHGLYANICSSNVLKGNPGVYATVLRDMTALYDKYGIIFSCASGKSDNVYFLKGTNRQISMGEAHDHVLKQIKKDDPGPTLPWFDD